MRSILISRCCYARPTQPTPYSPTKSRPRDPPPLTSLPARSLRRLQGQWSPAPATPAVSCQMGLRFRRGDVPTALRQNPADKDHSRLAREAPMHCAKSAGKNKGQRSRSRDQRPRKRYVATLNSSLRQPSISKPPPRAPRRAQQHRQSRGYANQWPPTASDDEYASPS